MSKSELTAPDRQLPEPAEPSARATTRAAAAPATDRSFGRRIECEQRDAPKQSPHGRGVRRG